MPSVFGNHEVQWQLFAEGALRNRVFHDDVMYRVKLVWPATGISITSTPPFRPKSTNTIIVICVFVPAAFCRKIRRISTDRPRRRNIHPCRIAGNVKPAIPNITEDASGKFFQFIIDATLIFMNGKNSGSALWAKNCCAAFILPLRHKKCK